MQNEKDLEKIIDYILEKYHNPLKINIPQIKLLLDKIVEVHWNIHPEFAKIRIVFNLFASEITSHIDKEEKILFPMMKEIELAFKNKNPLGWFHCWSVWNPIRQMELEHSNFDKYLKEIRILSSNYFIPSDACKTFTRTYEMLKELDNETVNHARLENDTLHKTALEKEKILNFINRNT